MILSAHYFRSHISRSSRCILRVVWSPDSGDSEVGYAKIPLFIEDQVFRLYVPMDDILVVDKLQACYQASYEKSYKRSDATIYYKSAPQ